MGLFFSQKAIAYWIISFVAGGLFLKLVLPLAIFAVPVRFKSTWVYRPTSGQYREARIDASGSHARDSDVVENAYLTLTLVTHQSVEESLNMIYKGDMADFVDRQCSPQKIQNWMQTLGIDISDARIQAESKELSSELMIAAPGYSGPSRTLKSLKPAL